jgi:hypothetical protein
MSAHYGNVTSSFGIGNTMIASISTGEYPYYTISQSYYQAPNTIVKLYDTSLTVPDYHSVVVGDINYIDSWTGDQKIDAQGSHTEGYNTRTLGIMSHAEGVFTQALGDFSHAEGLYTKALGYASHAEGYNTIAFGSGSHAEGLQTNAIGIHSHAAGYATIASGSYQSVIGQYNVSSSAQSAFIIGNGTSDGNRSNLVFASGSQVQITGSVLITQALTLPSQNPLPTVPAGSIAVSGSGVNMRPYFYNGSTWTPFY